MPVNFHFENTTIPLNNRDKLKNYISYLIDNECFTVINIDYVFCTDEFLLELNKNYLDHDTYTDILTFDLSEEKNKVSAEIYISGERVIDNAAAFNTSVEEELHRVIFHGILHLCGYDDHSDAEKKGMRKKENEYLRGYFNPNGE